MVVLKDSIVTKPSQTKAVVNVQDVCETHCECKFSVCLATYSAALSYVGFK